MNARGLGSPEPIGKQSLFVARPMSPQTAPKRVRLTLRISTQALQIIEAICQQHRIATGRSKPMWQVVDEAIASYGQQMGQGD